MFLTWTGQTEQAQTMGLIGYPASGRAPAAGGTTGTITRR